MTTNLIDEYRRTSYEISEAIAPGWYRRRAQFETAMTPLRDWMVRALAVREGATVLELAAGAGDTGFTAAAHAGRLICTDFSPAMLDVARRRAEELDIRNADFRVMDAEHLDLDTASVDGVLCRFGYMLIADPPPRWPRPAGCCAPVGASRWPCGQLPNATRSSRPSPRHLPKSGT
jgi:ubiquinone/menaquinone biosynthesis C-methylase UbiE